MCASWHSDPVFNRGLGLVLFELIELIHRRNVSSPTEQHIMAAEHVCWVVHSLRAGIAHLVREPCCVFLRCWGEEFWDGDVWGRHRFVVSNLASSDGNADRGRVGWIWPSISEEMIDKLSKWLELLDCSSTASTVVMSNDCIDVSTSWNVLDSLGWCRAKVQQYQWKCQFPIFGELRISRRSWKTRDSIGAAADVRGCWDCNRSSKNRSVHECEVYHGWRGMTMKGPPDRRKVQDGAGDENVKPKAKGDTSAKSIGNSSYPQTHFQGRCRHCGRKVTTCQTVGARNNVPSKISDGPSSSKGKSFKKESASCKWRRRFRKQSYNTSQYWTFLGLWDEKKCNGILLYTLEGKWDSKTAQMVERFKDTGHPVFKSISALSRGILIKEKQQRHHTLQCGCFKHRALVTDHSFCKSAQYLRSSFEMVWTIRLDKEKRQEKQKESVTFCVLTSVKS